MELIKSYNEENLFKTQFTTPGMTILILLVLALIGLGERVLYDLARTFAAPIGDFGYFDNSKVIIVQAIFIVGLLIVTILINYIFGRRKEKYAIALVPYFLTSILLSIQLAIQLGVYFTSHHNNLQFYLVMILLVAVSSYGIFHIQNNYKKERDTSQANSTGLLAIFVVVFALFAILILSFNNNDAKINSNISQSYLQQENNYNNYNNNINIPTPQNSNLTGHYYFNINYNGYVKHEMFLNEDASGNLSGNGGYPFGGNYTYAWTIDSGTVSNRDVDFWAHYTASEDAVKPLTVMHVVGKVTSDGTIIGTWSDNYQKTSRSGAFDASKVN